MGANAVTFITSLSFQITEAVVAMEQGYQAPSIKYKYRV